MIPRRVFVWVDVAIMAASYFAAYRLLPHLQANIGFWPRLVQWAAPTLLEQLTPALGLIQPISQLLWALLVIIPAAMAVLGASGTYTDLTRQSRTRICMVGVWSIFAGIAVASLVIYVFHMQDLKWSRLFLATFGALAAFGLTAYRLALRRYLGWRLSMGHYARNVVLVGHPASVDWIADLVELNARRGEYPILGYLDPDAASTVSPTPRGITRLGSVFGLDSLLVQRPIHDVIVVQPLANAEWVGRVVDACDAAGVTLRIIPDCCDVRHRASLSLSRERDPLNLPAVLLSPVKWDAEELFAKRVMDLAVASFLLVLLWPVFLVLAMLVKLSSRGPVFYRWHVIGRNGKPFVGFKFRTMVHNADELKAGLAQHNEMTGPVFKMSGDPRITRIGRWLRKYSLDELPQLYSVLKGDMSLVGPRPAYRAELERYEFWQVRKLSIRPGITCLWQIRGRNEISDFNQWVAMDLEYIDTWSLWLDLRILLRTAWAVLAGTGK